MVVTALKWPPELRPLPSPVADATWEQFRQATIDLAIERGYYGFEASDIVERAGASRADFDARFSGKRDCCDRTYDANIADFDQALVGAYLRAPSWREGIRAGAHGAAGYLRGHRRERRFGELRMRHGGAMEQAARDRYLQRIVDLIDVGRCEMSDPDAISRTTAEGVLGSIHQLLLTRLADSRAEGLNLEETINDVMYLAVRRYVGDEAGFRELSTSGSDPVRRR